MLDLLRICCDLASRTGSFSFRPGGMMLESRHLLRKVRLLMNLERLVDSRPYNLTFKAISSP